jgi:hypothetical protein
MTASDDPTARAGSAAHEKRRQLRRKVIWAARLNCALGERPCTVLNISRGGASLKLDVTLGPRTDVELLVPGIGCLSGRVVWSVHDRAGIQFGELSEALGAALDQALRGRRPGGA